jgi:streptogramin lyase
VIEVPGVRANATAVSSTDSVDNVSDHRLFRDVDAGPDGAIWFNDHLNDSIGRISVP